MQLRQALLLAFAAVSACAFARSPFASTIISAVDDNRATVADSLSAEAAKAMALAENAPDGPELEFEHLWSTNDEPNRWSVGISQEFNLPGAYSARKHAADAEAAAARAVLATVKADRALTIKEAILDLINANLTLAYYRETAARLDHMARAIEKSFDLGEATVLDRYKIRIAVLNNSREIASLEAQIESLEASLAGLGIAPASIRGLCDSYPRQEETAPAADHSSLIDAARDARAAANRAAAKALRMESMPSVKLGYAHAFEDGNHFNGFTVGISLPSFGTKKKMRAASLQADADLASWSSETDMAVAENDGLYKKALILRKNMEDYRDLTGDTAYLALLEKAYDGGQLTVINYLAELNMFSEARLAYLDLQYRYALTLARLNRYRSLDF